MKFTATSVEGVWLLDMERHEDERGWFARTWCRQELEAHGLDHRLSQCSSSFNKQSGTLRGMHFQAAPYEETKVVRCTRGSAYDVALDLRPNSPTYLRWAAATISAENGRALYIPKGCAHGFQTLEDDTEILYAIDIAYEPSASRGVRWDDPAFGIEWPHVEKAFLSHRDATYPNLIPCQT